MKLLYRVLPVPSTTGKKKAHPLRRIGFQGKLLYRDRLFVHAETSCAEARLDRRLPSFQRVSGAQEGRRSSTVLPMPLPPEVAKGITVFPEKSALSRKVWMMRGA